MDRMVIEVFVRPAYQEIGNCSCKETTLWSNCSDMCSEPLYLALMECKVFVLGFE